MCGRDLLDGRAREALEDKTVIGVRAFATGDEIHLAVRETGAVIAVLDRHEHVDGRTGLGQTRERREHAGFGANDAAQQRAPRQRHGDAVGCAVELARRGLDAGDDEQDVRDLLSLSSPRTHTQTVDARVERDRERGRIGAGGAKGRETVTGADVDDDAVRGGDQPAGLTDVHVHGALADEDAHEPMLCPPNRRGFSLQARNVLEHLF